MENKNLFIDARVLCDKYQTGVARYSLSIIKELMQADINITLVSNKKILHLPDRNDGCYLVKEFKYLRWLPGTLFVTLFLPFFLITKKNPVFWGCNHTVPIFGAKTIVTIHDMVAYDLPKTFTFINRASVKFSIRLSLIYSTYVTAVSNFTKNRIIDKFKFKKGKIAIISNGVDNNVFCPINLNVARSTFNTEQRNVLKLDQQFILAVGSIEPRKNLLKLVEAFEYVKSKNYNGNLILVGGGGWLSNDLIEKISESEYRDEIIFSGHISDSELNSMYNMCDFFVFPSLYEGFGIPPLEAYSAGANVVCSIYSELYNIVKDPLVTWYDPHQDDLNILLQAAIKNKCSANVHPKILDCSWKRSCKELLNILNKD